MAKTMKALSIVTILLTAIFALLYHLFGHNAYFVIAISAGTTAYHFTMRLVVGFLFDIILKNKVDYTKRWFCVGKGEYNFYKLLKVKRWKDKMPTFQPDTFDTSKHSWEEILQATCQSELVHETNVLLSFLPIIASIWFGEIWVFVATSILSALFDLLFVFMQRFNRYRLLKLQSRLQKN